MKEINAFQNVHCNFTVSELLLNNFNITFYMNVQEAGLTERRCVRLQTGLGGFDRLSENPTPGFLNLFELLELSPNIMIDGNFVEKIFRSLVNDIAIKTQKTHTRILKELSNSLSFRFSTLKDYYYVSSVKKRRGIKLSVLFDLLAEWKKICAKSENDVKLVMLEIFSCPFYDRYKAAFLPISLSESLAELIGILYGDGSIPKNKWYVQVTDQSKECLEYVCELFMRLFRIDHPKIKKDKGSNSYTIRVRSKIIVLYLLKFFGLPYGSKKEVLKMPQLFLNSKNEILAAFIRGLFSSDGTFKKDKYIVLEMAQENLIKGVKDVLEKRFGIRLYLGKDRGCWVIRRHKRKIIKKFLNEIGIIKPYL